LELFAQATNWKSYLAARIREHLGADVLEVGAGLGATTRVFCTGTHQRWVCLEPDAQLAAACKSAIAGGELPSCCQAQIGTLLELDAGEQFDSILYIDVLEHIQDDRAELDRAADRLKSNGKLIVLSPAHQWLFSPFDQSIGHYRRYNKLMMVEVAPPSLQQVRLSYLDSVGMLASMGNRFVLRSGMPSRRQLWVWDKLMVPVSRVLDPLLFYSLGKAILGVWQKPA
jgi:hypothetical protein